MQLTFGDGELFGLVSAIVLAVVAVVFFIRWIYHLVKKHNKTAQTSVTIMLSAFVVCAAACVLFLGTAIGRADTAQAYHDLGDQHLQVVSVTSTHTHAVIKTSQCGDLTFRLTSTHGPYRPFVWRAVGTYDPGRSRVFVTHANIGAIAATICERKAA